MGAIAKTVASKWLDRIDASRSQLIEAAKTGNRVLAAFAQADARAELIASLNDEEVQARLLKITDPELAMVELANNPTPQDRVRICAIAILSGFVPGDDQFAIFGGGKDRNGAAKPGKLYTKEAGFRTLFGHLGIVPELQTGFPEFLPYGKAGKKVWRVPGHASCVHNGKTYSVTCGEASEGIDDRISLPGYETDNVAGVAAKARRRLLQMLWSKVSPVLSEPQPDDDVEPIEQVEPERLEAPNEQQQQAAAPTSISVQERWKATYDAIQRSIKDDPEQSATAAEVWQAMSEAVDADHLRAIADASRDQILAMSKDNQKRFGQYKGALLEAFGQ